MPTIDYSSDTFAMFTAAVLPKVQELAFQANPLMAMLVGSRLKGSRDFVVSAEQLKGKGKARAMTNGVKAVGGSAFEVPLAVSSVGTTVTGSGVQSITNPTADFTNKARYTWTAYRQPVAIADDDWYISKAGDKKEWGVKVISLLEASSKQAMNSLIDEMSDDLFGTVTDPANGFVSLFTGIADSDVTYAGIDRTSVSAWVGNGENTGTLSAINTTTDASFIQTKMDIMVRTVCANGALEKDLCFVMGSSTQAAYRKSLTLDGQSSGRYDIMDGKGVPSVISLYFGAIPVIYDPHAAAGAVYLIDTATTYIAGVDGALFDAQDWKMSETNTQFYSRITFIGQLIVSDPKHNYYLLYS